MKWFGGNSGRGQAVSGLQGKTIDVGEHRLKVEEHLGDGGFAVIYRVRDVRTGQYYALKHIVMRTPEAKAALKDEAKIMKRVQGHPNIISLYCVAFGQEKEDEQDAFMLMDLCSESLYGYLQRKNFVLPDLEIIEIFREVCGAVQHLHSQKHPICHRDIKIENVLKHPNGRWVLCDFGSAKPKNKIHVNHINAQYEQHEINKTTTPAYRSPEMWDVMMRKPIDERADIWALGCMLYLLCYGILPFTGESQLEVMAGKSTFPQTRNAAFASVLAAMLHVEPEKRPDVQFILGEIEKIKHAIGGGNGTPRATAYGGVEPRSQSFTLRSDHVPNPQAGNKQSSLSTHPSLPNVAMLNDMMPNSARRAPATEPRLSRFSVETTNHPQKAMNNGSTITFPIQNMKSTMAEESEGRRPTTTTVPKLPVSPAVAGSSRAPDISAQLLEEVKSLKMTVSSLTDQNQVLYQRIVTLEATVKSQQQAIEELRKQKQVTPVPTSRQPTEATMPEAASTPPAQRLVVSAQQDAADVPLASVTQQPAVQTSSQPTLRQDQNLPPESTPVLKEVPKTPKSGTPRFGGTFWKTVGDTTIHQQESEENTSNTPEAIFPKFELENRHKRVVSDPPPLDSWHTSGKL